MLKKNDIKLQKKEKKEKKCNTCWLIETQSLTDFSLRKRLAKNLCERERETNMWLQKSIQTLHRVRDWKDSRYLICVFK